MGEAIMAINVAQQRPTMTGSKGRTGGAKTGQILGALGAGAAIAATGGGAGAVLGAAGTGSGLGGLAGGLIDPGKADTRQAIQRRVQSLGQESSQVNPQATMQEAIMALRQANDPQLTQQYAPTLVQGLAKTMVG